MKTFFFFTILCGILYFSNAANTVGNCNDVHDCYSCTNSEQSATDLCGWCISTTYSYCGLDDDNCQDTSGDQPDQWVLFQDGSNPYCSGGCEAAESCSECSSKPNCGYCHSAGGCTPLADEGGCDGAFTIGNCDLPCDSLDNCQNCLSESDTKDCQWCSTDDTNPKSGACANSGDTCVDSLLTDVAICPAFDDTGAASTIGVGVIAIIAVAATL